MPKNNSSINNSLFDLLKGRGYSPTMLSTAGKEIPTPDEAEVFQFNFVKDGEDYGKVTLTIDDSSNLIVYYSDDVADSEKGNGSTYDWDDFIDKVKDFKKSKKTSKLKEEDDDDEDFKSEGGDLSWYGLLNQLKRFAQRYQLSFELRNTDNLKSDMAKRDYMKKQDQISESKNHSMAEGYSLKKTNVEKTFDPGDPDEYTQDVNTTYTDYEIINNKTGQVVGTASWTTNDFMGPGALKITMKNGATRWLDIWEREKGNPQTAFNRFVKDPKTAKKYKEQDNKGVTEMDNRTPSGDRREQRANSPEEKAKREKEQQANLKKVSPKMREKLRLPEPKEDMAEGTESILARGTEVTVPHRGKMVPGKILRYVAGKGGYSDAYVVDIGEYESLTVPTFNVKTQVMAEASGDQVKKVFKKNGKPVGEVGIDPEASPGVGQWYMKCYQYKIDNSGYDSYEEAVEELKYCMKQGMVEARNPEDFIKDIKNIPLRQRQRIGKSLIKHAEEAGLRPETIKVGYSETTGVYQVTGLAMKHGAKYDWRYKSDPATNKMVSLDAMQSDTEYAPDKFMPIVFDKLDEQDMVKGTEDSTQVLSDIVANDDFDALYDLMSSNTEAGKIVQRMYNDVAGEEGLHPDDDFEQILNRVFDHLSQDYGQQGMEEGLGKDIKRLATGKDVKSRAGQEIAKSQDASMKGDTKTSKKHFDRYDKLDKLANKGMAEGWNKGRRAADVDRDDNKDPDDSLDQLIDLQGQRDWFAKMSKPKNMRNGRQKPAKDAIKRLPVAEGAIKKLSKGAKVYHTLHGTGTVIDFSTGPAASHWVDVKFIKDGNKGKPTRVDRKQLKLAKVESMAEGYYGDDRGDYRKTAREANAASRLAKSSKTHAEAARLHNLAATYALSAGQDQSVIRDHQMAAHEHNQAAKKYKKGMAEGYTVTRGIDTERYQERPGLEGPFATKSGKVVYYDKREGKYYDPDTDMYIEYDDWQAMNEQDMAESNQQVNESYYPMGKQGSYSDAVPTTKIIIQHSRRIEEGEQRYRNIAKIFVENSEGERFAVPTNKPGLARVYARHIAEGGTPYDERGRHITSLVEEYSKMSGFMRATRGKQFNESAQQLVTEAVNYYQSLRESLSKMTGHRGYSAYFESWTPSLMEDGEEQETNLNELFVQETLDPRIESVMPILGKLQRKLGTIKEVDALAEWADNIIEGDGGQEALTPQGIPEAAGPETLAHNIRTDRSNLKAFDLEETTGVTDYNPKSQGGTRAELLRKYANTKKPKDAEAARRAGASQSELKAAADSTEEIHEGEHGLDENLDANQISAGQLGPTEKAKSISPVLGAQPKQHPFKGKLVGAEESVNESENELARILQMVKHKR